MAVLKRGNLHRCVINNQQRCSSRFIENWIKRYGICWRVELLSLALNCNGSTAFVFDVVVLRKWLFVVL